ncbi:MAG: 1,4-alpha-glucan branching protein GlgB [Lewinellaceae bacterium]|nr:1,4-alpha-glucan branching protein GlgB [Lewinellaceae bacterium]
MVFPFSLFSDFDISLFKSGTHCRLFEKFGSRIVISEGQSGCYFSVYAPGAKCVEVIGSFNEWNGKEHQLMVRWDSSGIWEGFIPGVNHGDLYKYRIYSHHDETIRDKTDPYALYYEIPPKTASIVWNHETLLKNSDDKKNRRNALSSPISIYEVHLGSWKKKSEHESLSYLELADELTDYVMSMGYTHVEFLPVMEHPYYPSWGYLCTGYFAPTSRYGLPEDFLYLVNSLQKNDIGVILDWVPAHFPSDGFALADFDGTKVYEHPDKSKGFHPDWNSLIFNFERPEVKSFLLSSAHFWLEYYGVDGLRVDAVASMLYLDYSRNEGEWSPNEFGGNTYLAAIEFLQELNKSIYREFPDTLMIAEESTAFSGVTKPVDWGGLGFGLKWMMGWMNDTLEFFSRDPIHRSYHHLDISRSLTYAFTENYVLPLSHDEVVHGKQSIYGKMPGDEWQKFANLRILYLYMYTHPGQKLLFMGNDIGQTTEWNVNQGLPWFLLDRVPHKALQAFIQSLNSVFKSIPALYENNYSPDGFEWIEYNDFQNSILTYRRIANDGSSILIILNLTPTPHENYRIGWHQNTTLTCILNSDLEEFFGSGFAFQNRVLSSLDGFHGRPYSVTLSVPPLCGLIYVENTK